MKYFSAQTKRLFTSIYLCACFTLPVYAEENSLPAVQVTEETPQQTLTDVENNPESVQIPDIKNKNSETTPQPPLIEPQTIQNYEPKIPDETTISDPVVEKDINKDSSRTIGDTPQPPLFDPQQEPSYGPKIEDNSETKDKIIPADEIIKAPKTSVIDQPVESSEIVEPSESTEDNTEGTIIEQEKIAADKAEAITKEREQAKKWTETYPVSINADWLQLKSGEWLRGRITIMQKESLEFDSDELDNLVIKWKNVKYLKSYEPYGLRFDSTGRDSIIGVVEVIGDKVHIKTDYDDQTFDRSDLLTIASGKETEISYWKNKVTFGVNIRKGNTDQTDFTSKMTAKRRTTDSRLVLDYLGNYTEVIETETVNNHRINQTYDIFLTRDLFWRPIFSEFFRDSFQNIDRRLNVGIGIGYSIINTTDSEWDISAGPAYQQTKFDSVQPGVDQIDSTLTLALGTKFETELNPKVDLEGLYSISLGDAETGNYSHHSLLTIETELTDKLDFDVTAVWDYVRSPVTGSDGDTPDQDDFRITIGLGYDL